MDLKRVAFNFYPPNGSYWAFQIMLSISAHCKINEKVQFIYYSQQGIYGTRKAIKIQDKHLLFSFFEEVYCSSSATYHYIYSNFQELVRTKKTAIKKKADARKLG